MALPQRRVKYVVDKVLRQMKIVTDFVTSAPDGAIDKVFNDYIDMLIDWDSQGIVSGLTIPDNVNNPLGNSVPANNLIAMLTARSAGEFNYALTAVQMGAQSRAFGDLMAGQCKPSIASNPVPNGYLRYNRWPINCCGQTNEELFHDDCTTATSPLISNDGQPLVAGT